MRVELSSITARVLWTLTGLLDGSALPSPPPLLAGRRVALKRLTTPLSPIMRG